MPQLYRTLPWIIEAVQLCYANVEEMHDFVHPIIGPDNLIRFSDSCSETCGEDEFLEFDIPTRDGVMLVRHGDYVIKEPLPNADRNYFYPCKPDIFRTKYEGI